MKGLYALTDPLLCGDGEQLVACVLAAIKGGVSVIQYRDKHSEPATALKNALALAALCKQHKVTFLINDDVDLAVKADADGVHLGQGDTSLAKARQLLGKTKVIGITCHADIELAKQAELGGADYVAFGAFFPSVTKPNAKIAPLAVLRTAKTMVNIPVVAIGGIDATNIALVKEAGADMVAVVGAVFANAQTTIEPATRRLVNLIT